MPASTVVDVPQEAQRQLRAAWRRARYGDLLARHMLL